MDLVTTAERLWMTCAEALRQEVSDAAWHAMFDGVTAEDGDDGAVVLLLPNSLVRDRIEERYQDLLRGVLADAGGGDRALRLHVRAASAGWMGAAGGDTATGRDGGPLAMASRGLVAVDDEGDDEEDETPPDAAPLRPRRYGPSGHHDDVPLDRGYTFEDFVIGEANRFAHAAARSVAENPARSYNPLFIYGAAGLGKTHLQHAIGNYVRNHFPQRRVRYVSTETFLNEYVDMIRTNTGAQFRSRYRSVDVLLIDDVQFLANKEGLQEEFFHTFNSLYQAASQIVLTSDTHPRAIPTLEDRLKSRFQWGLVTDVQPPDLETRLAILRKKAEGETVDPPEDVLELIASHVKDNIRELEGALTRVVAWMSLNERPPTVAEAEDFLADVLDQGEHRRITPRLVIDCAAKVSGFTVDELVGPARKRPLVEARQIAMYVMRELTELSYPSIGEEFGGRDHTTVMHACTQIARKMKEKRVILDQVAALRQTVISGG